MTKKQLVLFSLSLSFLLLIRLLFFFYLQKEPQIRNGEYLDIKTTLQEEPKISGNYQYFNINEKGSKVRVLTQSFPVFHYSDTLKINGEVRENSNQKFRLLTLNFPKIEKVDSNNLFTALVSRLRIKLTSNFSQTLSPFGSSLLLGIVFGIRDSIPKDILENLKITGVMHVTAASGMNVTMLAGFLTYLTLLFFKRKIALFITIAGIFFYAFLAGFEASIVRASIMGMIVFSAQILGRQTISSYCLFLTAVFMLFFNPNYIADVGFQLSFLSTIGLLHIPPLFKGIDTFRKTIFGESVITTISAQIATLPLMFYYFGSYSPWSIIVNALVLWTIPPLMLLGGLSGVLVFIFPLLSKLILFLCVPFLVFFEKIVVFFALLPLKIELSSFPIAFVLSYYLILVALVMYLKGGKKLKK